MFVLVGPGGRVVNTTGCDVKKTGVALLFTTDLALSNGWSHAMTSLTAQSAFFYSHSNAHMYSCTEFFVLSNSSKSAFLSLDTILYLGDYHDANTSGGLRFKQETKGWTHSETAASLDATSQVCAARERERDRQTERQREREREREREGERERRERERERGREREKRARERESGCVRERERARENVCV